MASKPEAAAIVQIPERPSETEWPDWADFYIHAWKMLQTDRQYGSMGDVFPITFTTLDRFARRFNITGKAFDVFCFLMQEMDAEYCAIMNKKGG